MSESRLAVRTSAWRRRLDDGAASEVFDAPDVDPFGDDQSVADSGSLLSAGNSISDTSGLLSHRRDDMFQERSKLFNDIANKSLHPSEPDLMIQGFIKQKAIPFSRTYRFGKAVGGEWPETVMPAVGFVFLPGADLPEVNRLEGHDMVDDQPDQRDATWRVNTAATLLSVSYVGRDLSIVTHDITPHVAQNTRLRLDHKPTPERGHRGQIIAYRPDAVTIDSEKVRVYHDLGSAELDIGATLVEVNVNSLMSLMLDYRYIINHSGPTLTFQETKDLLERMIEAARLFCINSPILFRMATRKRIIHSTDIRYGVNNEQSFVTFTTSKGIQEIIMMSASYFNSLDPSTPGMKESTQREIRPRFLQMLTLLLSLLHQRDLGTMAEFIQRTYGINPERSDLELLFCKVIPLTSINPKVFLQALVPAVDDRQINIKFDEDYAKRWEVFLIRIARKGYLLPGTLDDLGHARSSWVMKWPEEGIRSSTVFSRLQYHGMKTSTFNQIPSGRFRHEPGLTELTVMLTNLKTYTIHPDDYERISSLTQGSYNITNCEDGSICDLVISEFMLNNDVNAAIRVINEAIRRFNLSSAPQSRSRKGTVLRRRREPPVVFPDLESAARLSLHQAFLQGNLLAVGYKLDGKIVPRTEALRHLSFHYNRAHRLFKHLCESCGRAVGFYERHIGEVKHFLGRDRQVHEGEKARQVLSDSPIARAYHPEDSFATSPSIWYSYWVDVRHHLQTGRDLLHIGARIDVVAKVTWRKPGQQAELRLAQMPTVFFVGPLKPVSEKEQGEEVRVGDHALLVGKYIIIAAPHTEDANLPYLLLNWLEVQEEFSEESRRRGRNYRGQEQLPVTAFL